MNNIAERYRLAHLMKQQEAGVKKKLRWNTPAEVRRSLARVNNWVVNGIFYSANLILKALEQEKQ